MFQVFRALLLEAGNLCLEIGDASVAVAQLLSELVELSPDPHLTDFLLSPEVPHSLQQILAVRTHLVVALRNFRKELLRCLRVITTKPALQDSVADGVGCDLSKHEVEDQTWSKRALPAANEARNPPIRFHPSLPPSTWWRRSGDRTANRGTTSALPCAPRPRSSVDRAAVS